MSQSRASMRAFLFVRSTSHLESHNDTMTYVGRTFVVFRPVHPSVPHCWLAKSRTFAEPCTPVHFPNIESLSDAFGHLLYNSVLQFSIL
jgi:hypothetical protein